MTLGMIRGIFGGTVVALALGLTLPAQQDTSGVQQDAGQVSPPTASSNGGRVESDKPAATQTAPDKPSATNKTGSAGAANQADLGDNPYAPILEPPPLPKGKPTLIGGIATNVDHVRNHITLQPFGGGKKVSAFVDERSHIYRNGTETTILGVHKGDRVYLDTMLDPRNNKVFARNVRVVTDTGLAEVRGQVIATRPDRGAITVRDQLSAKPVSFSVSAGPTYASSKGPASAADVQPGSLIDVHFSPRTGGRDIAREITVVAKPGDDCIFSGVVSHLDMRTDSMFVDNKSDDQTYEVRFTPGAVSDMQQLKVGLQVTARAVFDGRQYKASNIRIENHGE